MRKIILSMTMLLAFSITACKSDKPEEKKGPTKKVSTEWPQLSKLDHLMHDISQYAENNDMEKLRPVVKEATAIIIEMKKEGQPIDARNPVKVEGLLEDLAMNALEITSIKQDDESLKTKVGELGEMTESLMKEAGVEHAH